MRVESHFDGGRIEVVASGTSDIELAIPPDPADARFRQWFSFALTGERGAPRTVHLVNAGKCTWARGFRRYDVCASYDGERWFRVPSDYDGEALRFSHAPDAERVQYAYFAPYSEKRLEALLRKSARAGAKRSVVAKSGQGRPLPMLTFGTDGDAAPHLWLIAQQHPGEPMAGWFMEGLAERLASRDEVSRALLARAVVHLVPRMNPDGVVTGNHRTNAAGLDLNRQWAAPAATAPEVAGVRAAMIERGAHFFLDVHGDETIPYVFVQGTEGNPRRTDRIAALEASFSAAMLDASPDFQTEHSYPRDLPGEAKLCIAANYVGDAFDCLSMTLEMPFTDNANAPDDAFGWSPERSRKLGADTVEALAAVAGGLR